MVCNVGWLVSEIPEDGRYVPFFLKVRSKDICWYDLPSEDLLSLLEDNERDEYSILYPKTALKFKRNGWNITLNYDFTFEINKKFVINKDFKLDKTFKELVLTDVKLPFIASYDKDFTITATKVIKNKCTNLAVKYSNCAVQMDDIETVAVTKPYTFNGLTTVEVDNYHISDSIDICLFNSGKFTVDETTDENVFIDVTIRGEVFTLEDNVETVINTDISDGTFKEKTELFTETFYEQYGYLSHNIDTNYYANELVDMSGLEDAMYMNIGGNFANISAVSIKNETYEENDKKPSYIGNGNIYIRPNLWKLNEKNELLLFIPLLANAAIENDGISAPLNINGYDFNVICFKEKTDYIDLETRFKNSVVSMTW